MSTHLSGTGGISMSKSARLNSFMSSSEKSRCVGSVALSKHSVERPIYLNSKLVKLTVVRHPGCRQRSRKLGTQETAPVHRVRTGETASVVLLAGRRICSAWVSDVSCGIDRFAPHHAHHHPLPHSPTGQPTIVSAITITHSRIIRRHWPPGTAGVAHELKVGHVDIAVRRRRVWRSVGERGGDLAR